MPEAQTQPSLLAARIEYALEIGTRFLESRYDEGSSAWGLFRGDAADVHYSSLAIAAVARYGSARRVELATNLAERFLLPSYGTYEFRALNREQLLAVVRAGSVCKGVFASEGDDFDSLNRLHQRASLALSDLVKEDVRQLSENPKEAAKVLLVVDHYVDIAERRAMIDALVSALGRRQTVDGDRGWWSAGTRSDRPDLVATCLAHLALTRADGEPKLRLAARSAAFLGAQGVDMVRSDLSRTDNVYALAVSLRAFSASQIDADLIAELCSRMSEQLKEDGGWGGSGRFGNVEATSHAVLSLIEARPLLVDPESIGLGTRGLATAQADALPVDPLDTVWLMRALLESSNSVVEAVQRLESRVLRLSADLAAHEDLSTNVEPWPAPHRVLQDGSGLVGRGTTSIPRLTNVMAGSSVLLAAVSVFVIAYDVTSTFGLVVTAPLAAALGTALIALMSALYRRGRAIGEVRIADQALYRLVDDFITITNDVELEPARRVLEVVERFLAELPQDLFVEEIEHLLRSEGVASVSFSRWLRELAHLHPTMRREVLWTLNRQVWR